MSSSRSFVRLFTRPLPLSRTQQTVSLATSIRHIHHRPTFSPLQYFPLRRATLSSFNLPYVQLQARNESNSTPSVPSTSAAEGEATSKEQAPAYEMTFTCKVCETRSTHRISKQGYHKGTVLIACPGCKNRHLIADHLKIFSDKSVTMEDIMREKGQLVKRGTLDLDSDVEFWEDGTSNPRESSPASDISSSGNGKSPS